MKLQLTVEWYADGYDDEEQELACLFEWMDDYLNATATSFRVISYKKLDDTLPAREE
jgi:hypothetical protein